MVGQVQLCVLPPERLIFFVRLTLPILCCRRFVRRARFWLGYCGRSHIFHPSVPEERDDRAEHCANLVGKYGVFEHGGCKEVALQAIACERHLWASLAFRSMS